MSEMMPQEIELKYVIPDKSEYERLLGIFGQSIQHYAQVNYYFDTDGMAVLAKGGMLRIRQQNHQYYMTLKYQLTRSKGYYTVTNVETEISEKLFIDIVNHNRWDVFLHHSNSVTTALWNLIPETPLTCLGILRNQRSVCFREGLQLEIDYSQYSDGYEDFELECETQEEAKARSVIARINQLHRLHLMPQQQTKFERFLHHL